MDRRFLVPALCVLTLSAGLPSAAAAQDYSVAQSAWTDPEDALPHPRLVPIGIPREAGELRLTELGDFGDNGGLDNIAQYRDSADEIWGTVFIYQTTLTDPAIAAVATDLIIRHSYGAQTVETVREWVPAGSVEDLALLLVYDHAFDGERASAAAFFGAGVWTVKLRVTGPQDRRDDVVAAMRALLDGVSFAPEAEPFAPRELTIGDCAAAEFAQPAQPLSAEQRNDDDDAPTVADALIAIGIVAGSMISNRHEIAEQIPDGPPPFSASDYCVMGVEPLGRQSFALALRRPGSGATPDLVLIGDAGRGFETIVSPSDEEGILPRTGVHVMFHSLGRAELYGPFDRPPTMDQFFSYLTGEADWLGESALSVEISPEGNTQINVSADALE
ncbi:MAG: hypothetical protein LC634_08405 [Sphingomonadales bacterium]|nr:hypothetical protein [Sphingomonadales bacterium]